MMNRYTFLLTTLLLAVGCSRQKTILKLSSGSEGGIYYPLAKSMADVINKKSNLVHIEVMKSPGSVENSRRLGTGEVDLALIQNDINCSSSTRTLVPVHNEILHFLVRNDSPIHSVYDLYRKRVGVGAKGSGSELVVLRLLGHYGIAEKDFYPNHDEFIEAGDKLLEGEIDTLLLVAGIKPSVCNEIIATGQLRFVSLGEVSGAGNEVEGFQLEYPFIQPFILPKSTYFSRNTRQYGFPSQPIMTFKVPSSLVATSKLEVDLATDIVQILIENRSTLVRQHHSAILLDEQCHIPSLPFPLHEGAANYFDRNKPGFLVRYAEFMAFILSAVIAVMGLLGGIYQWLKHKKKARIDIYYEYLSCISDQLQDKHQTTDDLKLSVKKLHQLRTQAIGQLTKEELEADESFLIFQSMLAECHSTAREMLERELSREPLL